MRTSAIAASIGGLPGSAWALGAAVGAAAGATYTASPTTVWFALLLPFLFVWARAGLAPRERRWVLGVLGVSTALRVSVLALLFLSADRLREPFAVLIGDERFMIDRSMWMVTLAHGHTLFSRDYQDTFGLYGQSGLQYVFAYWQLWFGPAPYGVRLLNVLMWLVGAIALHRAARRAFGPLPALGGLVVLLCTPSLFAWSISALKEPAYFLLTALTLVGAMSVVRGPGRGLRVAAAVLVVVAVAAITTLRAFALFVAAGGLLVAVTGWLVTRRAGICAAALSLAVIAGAWAVRQPEIESRVMQQARAAAISHLGNVNTPGYAYRLLDPQFYSGSYSNDLSAMVPAEAARFTVRAAVSFFTVPLPWTAASGAALMLLPQQIAWYLLAALVWVGSIAGWRRDAAFTWVLVGNALIGAAVVSLHDGNVGTLVRMRDTVVPVLTWLGALGGCAALDWTARRVSKEPLHAAL